MSAIKVGPPWKRSVFDLKGRVFRRNFRVVCRFDDVKQLTLREYVTQLEEEQLLNAHPEVQKDRRTAELWAETKDGRRVLLAELDQAGLLLTHASAVAEELKVPVVAERSLLALPGGQAAPRKT